MSGAAAVCARTWPAGRDGHGAERLLPVRARPAGCEATPAMRGTPDPPRPRPSRPLPTQSPAPAATATPHPHPHGRPRSGLAGCSQPPAPGASHGGDTCRRRPLARASDSCPRAPLLFALLRGAGFVGTSGCPHSGDEPCPLAPRPGSARELLGPGKTFNS